MRCVKHHGCVCIACAIQRYALLHMLQLRLLVMLPACKYS